jgi:hypothetical protein
MLYRQNLNRMLCGIQLQLQLLMNRADFLWSWLAAFQSLRLYLKLLKLAGFSFDQAGPRSEPRRFQKQSPPIQMRFAARPADMITTWLR